MMDNLPTGEGRFLANALSEYRAYLTRGAVAQRRRVFRALNNELVGEGYKYADLASRLGKERAVELYLRGLVEHGIRPTQVANSSAITTTGGDQNG